MKWSDWQQAPSSGLPDVDFPAPADRPQKEATPLSLRRAIDRALSCDGRVLRMQAALETAHQRFRAATDIKDPEFSADWTEGRANTLHQDWSTRDTRKSGNSNRQSTTTRTDTSLLPGGTDSIRTTDANENSSFSSSSHRSRQATGMSWNRDHDYSLGLRVYLPNPWLLGPRIHSRKAEWYAAKADLANAQWQTRLDVTRAFEQITYLKRDLAVAENLLRLRETILEISENRGDDLFSRIKAEQPRLDGQIRVDRIRLRLLDAIQTLAGLVNLPQESLRLNEGPWPPPEPSNGHFDTNRIVAAAVKARADLASLAWRALAAREAYREVRNKKIPWITHLDASYAAGSRSRWGNASTTGSGSSSSSTTKSKTSQGQDSDLFPGGIVLPTKSIHSQQDSVGSGTSRWTESGTSRSTDAQDASEWQVGFVVNVPLFSWFWNHNDEFLLSRYNLALADYQEGARRVNRDVHNALDNLAQVKREYDRCNESAQALLERIQQTLGDPTELNALARDQVTELNIYTLQAARRRDELRMRYRAALLELERAAGAPLETIVPPLKTPETTSQEKNPRSGCAAPPPGNGNAARGNNIRAR